MEDECDGERINACDVEFERLVVDGQINIHHLCDRLLVNGGQRGYVQREREDRRVAERSLKLERYKPEVYSNIYFTQSRVRYSLKNRD